MKVRNRALRLLALGVLAAATVMISPGGANAEPGPVNVHVPSGPDVRAVPGSYIVQVRQGVDIPGLARAQAFKTTHVFHTALNGFAATLKPAQLEALRKHPGVEAISQNVESDNALDATQINPTWGIDRVDQRFLPLSNSYTWWYGGTKTRVYVIDTGIDTSHPEFGGRALWMKNTIDANNTDCHSHGTHVAGTVGSKTYGVAKDVKLRAVKALNCAGGTNSAALVAAVDWVATYAIKPAVVNTSWNWPGTDTALETALNNMIAKGMYLAASAGNTGGNSCDRLPRKIASALVVGNSNASDQRSASSSIGPCVDIYAPGSSIRSTLPGGGNGLKSGTSMAAPHVAGIAALWKDAHGDMSQGSLNYRIIACSTPNVLTGDLMGTPNRLANTCGF
ncbi:MAG: S8 family peptidase [Micromonosporaceae bacterium]